MKNEYKRKDIFYCSHQSHLKFDKIVTPYHILHKKKCFPEGCISFNYHCKLLEKRKGGCPKKYKYVGKNCPSCKDYYDEKIQRIPQISSSADIEKFWEDYHEFEGWVEENEGKFARVLATIDSIKPLIVKNEIPRQESIKSSGFLIGFKEAFLDYTNFEDDCYLLVSKDSLNRYKFSIGDKIEFDGMICFSEGRLVFRRMRNVDIEF